MAGGYYHRRHRRPRRRRVPDVRRPQRRDVFKASDYKIFPVRAGERAAAGTPAVAEAAAVPARRTSRARGAEGVHRPGGRLGSRARTSRRCCSSTPTRDPSPHKRVRRLEFGELPRPSPGKIRRIELREATAAGSDAEEVPRGGLPVNSAHTHGVGDTPLLGDTIGANLDRAVAAWPDREALVDAWYRGGAGRTPSSPPTSTSWRYALFASGISRGDRCGHLGGQRRLKWVLVQYATAPYRRCHGEHQPGLPHPWRPSTSSTRPVSRSWSPPSATDERLPGDGRASCEVGPRLRETVFIGDPELGGADPRAGRAVPFEELSCDDPINIQYTPGRQRASRRATLSHHNILNNGYFVGESVAYDEQDRLHPVSRSTTASAW